MDYLRSLGRKKNLDFNEDDGKPKLKRVLTVVDLTGLGVGSTLGLGVYVLAGSVAKYQAGPAVIISFLIAAVASAFAGVCYAEFAARVPKAGSAYVYSYVSVGEFVAFIIGWNLILEYVIGTAGVARGLSNYIDALSNNSMKNALTDAMPINVDFLSSYPDFLSFGLVMILAGLLAFGVKESTMLNNIFTGLNMIVIGIVIVAGAMKADPANWNIPKRNITIDPQHPEVGGEGGFMPYGVSGIMAGAAKCFFGFVGFDCVATTGEEAKNPQRNIPLAILLSLIIIFLSYFGISTVLTMMYPYYLQDPDAPFPYVFEQVGWTGIKWVVTIGAIFALCTSMLGAMFPLPRVLYAMGKDGLIFKSLAKINTRTQTPIAATILSGLLSGFMAMIFNLQQLIDMMSIGTLLAYTIVAICVLILRYEETVQVKVPPVDLSLRKRVENLFNLHMIKYPTEESSLITKYGTVVFTIFSCALTAMVIYAGEEIGRGEPWAVILVSIFGLVLVSIIISISRQPHSSLQLSFKVPLVPLIPTLSILINVYLMLELDYQTWIRFLVWMAIGFLIYFLYGHKNSVEGYHGKSTKVENQKYVESMSPKTSINGGPV